MIEPDLIQMIKPNPIQMIETNLIQMINPLNLIKIFKPNLIQTFCTPDTQVTHKLKHIQDRPYPYLDFLNG